MMKNKNIQQEIRLWENQTIKITNKFLYDYFDDGDPYYFYVADEIGGILNYGDYFFDFSTVLKCYELNISREQLFEWYDFCLENKKVNISLAKFILSPQERKEQEKIVLEQSKERLKFAQEEFNKALEKYEDRNTSI